MREITWSAVSARRLERQGLAEPFKEAAPADVVAAMCAAHAQVLTAGEHSIGLRTESLTQADVREALWTEHSLIKTFGPRGTVHMVPARDLPMWTGALSAVPRRPGEGFAADVRLTPEQTEQVIEAIGVVLEGAELTIDELSDAVVAHAGSWAGDLVMPAFQTMWPRWRQVMHLAGFRGALCFGPNRGRKVTYTGPRHWLPGFERADAPGALADLVKEYLRAYGPATPQQFAKWLSTSPKWAAELFASLSAELEQVSFDGAPAWLVAGDPMTEEAEDAPPPRGVRLLPYFDAFTIASYPRERLFPGRAAERALGGGQAGNFPVLLIDGLAAGVWHLRRSGRRLAVTVEPLAELTTAQLDELAEQVERIGRFFDGRTELTIGTITVGAHA